MVGEGRQRSPPEEERKCLQESRGIQAGGEMRREGDWSQSVKKRMMENRARNNPAHEGPLVTQLEVLFDPESTGSHRRILNRRSRLIFYISYSNRSEGGLYATCVY